MTRGAGRAGGSPTFGLMGFTRPQTDLQKLFEGQLFNVRDLFPRNPFNDIVERTKIDISHVIKPLEDFTRSVRDAGAAVEALKVQTDNFAAAAILSDALRPQAELSGLLGIKTDFDSWFTAASRFSGVLPITIGDLLRDPTIPPPLADTALPAELFDTARELEVQVEAVLAADRDTAEPEATSGPFGVGQPEQTAAAIAAWLVASVTLHALFAATSPEGELNYAAWLVDHAQALVDNMAAAVLAVLILGARGRTS